ncbi:M24 family metallopeptidase [Zavarzinella formosa]|uniref:M24 family metallopeptidase n=1 Tax=Zavarzinella formosa TaxID=360055 RepID=UPI0002F1A6E9|nr:M24 family metallopeptidase [Zavarzinella formosa]
MPSPEEKTAVTQSEAEIALRRLDIDAKQEMISRLLHDSQSDGLLVLHPANFRWLTAGAEPVGFFGRDERPALFFNPTQRWLICSATDSQRFFDEELDRLGFQLKEWQWTASRDQLMADLVYGRKIASDQPFRDCKDVGSYFLTARRHLSQYEWDHLRALGKLTAHAVEATARNITKGEPEEEIAGHLAHRLFRHGVHVEALQVSGDGRSRQYRRREFSHTPVNEWVTLQATARKDGLFATCSRTVCFGQLDSTVRSEFNLALRLGATHIATAKLGEKVIVALEAGKILLKPTQYEHEWRLTPMVALTAREPSEGIFLPTSGERWLEGWAAVWQERIGSAAVVDTFLLHSEGWENLTPANDWPVRRAVFQGRTYDRPDVLIRSGES